MTNEEKFILIFPVKKLAWSYKNPFGGSTSLLIEKLDAQDFRLISRPSLIVIWLDNKQVDRKHLIPIDFTLNVFLLLYVTTRITNPIFIWSAPKIGLMERWNQSTHNRPTGCHAALSSAAGGYVMEPRRHGNPMRLKNDDSRSKLKQEPLIETSHLHINVILLCVLPWSVLFSLSTRQPKETNNWVRS